MKSKQNTRSKESVRFQPILDKAFKGELSSSLSADEVLPK